MKDSEAAAKRKRIPKLEKVKPKEPGFNNKKKRRLYSKKAWHKIESRGRYVVGQIVTRGNSRRAHNKCLTKKLHARGPAVLYRTRGRGTSNAYKK